MAESRKRSRSDSISDLSPKKSAVPEPDEQVTPRRGVPRTRGRRTLPLASGRSSSGSPKRLSHDLSTDAASIPDSSDALKNSK